MARGRFIVLEGLDGAGITTQTEYLRTSFEKHSIPVSVTKEPSDGPAGGIIKQALRHRLSGLTAEALALLFAADRVDHVRSEIIPALDTGAMVVCDRYWLSSFAYQLVEVDDLPWLREINSRCPAPELTVYLDVPAEVCLHRMTTDAWRGADQLQLYEEVTRLTKVRENFLSIIPALQTEGHRIVIVDGTRDIATIARKVMEAVAEMLDHSERRLRRSGEPNSGSEQIAAILQGKPAAG